MQPEQTECTSRILSRPSYSGHASREGFMHGMKSLGWFTSKHCYFTTGIHFFTVGNCFIVKLSVIREISQQSLGEISVVQRVPDPLFWYLLKIWKSTTISYDTTSVGNPLNERDKSYETGKTSRGIQAQDELLSAMLAVFPEVTGFSEETAMRLIKNSKTAKWGYFLCAESFYNVAT